jgi:hypothetical protein
LAVAIVTPLVLGAVPAQATTGNDLPAPTVHPDAVAPGGTVSISGSGCVIGIFPALPGPQRPLEVFVTVSGIVDGASVVPSRDGSWSVDIPVPTTAAAGTHQVRAACDFDHGDAEFAYPEAHVTVTGATATGSSQSPTFTLLPGATGDSTPAPDHGAALGWSSGGAVAILLGLLLFRAVRRYRSGSHA